MGWLIVLFDLPVTSKEERLLASRFRNSLLDEGYLMLQFSVYARCAVTIDRKPAMIRKVKRLSPGTGNIQCIFITDALWEQSEIIHSLPKERLRQITKDDRFGEQLQFW